MQDSKLKAVDLHFKYFADVFLSLVNIVNPIDIRPLHQANRSDQKHSHQDSEITAGKERKIPQNCMILNHI